MSHLFWPGLLSSVFLAIVFLQSGLDKMFNYRRELGWIRQKFSRSALHDYVAPLFFVLASFEVISGLLSLGGAIQLLFTCSPFIAVCGAWAASATMLMLIFGQRITKDYTGAATLVPYFIASILALYFLSGLMGAECC